jgi:hypothetical protein
MCLYLGTGDQGCMVRVRVKVRVTRVRVRGTRVRVRVFEPPLLGWFRVYNLKS